MHLHMITLQVVYLPKHILGGQDVTQGQFKRSIAYLAEKKQYINISDIEWY